MLRISCTNCHMPFILNRDALQAALDQVDREGYKHFNAYCNNCGRPNKLSKKQLTRSAPWWKAGSAQAAAKKAPVKASTSKAGAKKKAPAKAITSKAGAKKKTPAKTSASKASTKKKTPAKASAKKKAPVKSKTKTKKK